MYLLVLPNKLAQGVHRPADDYATDDAQTSHEIDGEWL